MFKDISDSTTMMNNAFELDYFSFFAIISYIFQLFCSYTLKVFIVASIF